MDAASLSAGRGKGAVAAGHPLTATAAAEVLTAGGNAFDAALAAMCTATVAEPVLASFGGGGFLLARPADGPARLFDFFAQTPKRGPDPGGRDFYPVVADFGAAQQEFHIGLGSMAVPGAVSGLFEAHRALGRMPLARIVEPALAVARDGYDLTPFQGYLFSVVGPIYMASAGARRIFARPDDDDHLIGTGDHFRNPDAADFLEALVRDGPDLFYRGDIARRIVEDCRTGGGTLSADDLDAYRTEQRSPLAVDFAGARILTNPPPSSGGLLIVFALKLMERTGALAGDWGTPEHLSLLARVFDVTDGARRTTPAEDLTSLLEPEAVVAYQRAVAAHPQARRGTTHVSVIDGAGNACALTLSNGEGAGYVVPGTGVMMNNMLGEEDINPGGFESWPLDRRMGSMMAPTAVLGDGRIWVLGSGGSNRIRTAVAQVIANLVAFGMPSARAVDCPRIHVEHGRLDIEPGWSDAAVAALAEGFPDARIWPDRNLFFGGVHVAAAGAEGFEAAGDPRRCGAALVPGA